MPTFQDFVCLFLIQTNKQKLLLSRLAGTLFIFGISVFITITIPDNILGIFFPPSLFRIVRIVRIRIRSTTKTAIIIMIRRTKYDAMAIAINIFSCDSIPVFHFIIIIIRRRRFWAIFILFTTRNEKKFKHLSLILSQPNVDNRRRGENYSKNS